MSTFNSPFLLNLFDYCGVHGTFKRQYLGHPALLLPKQVQLKVSISLDTTINPSGGRHLPLQPQTLTISCLWRMKGKFCRELLTSLLKMKTACRLHHQFPIALWSCPSLLSPPRRRRTGSGKGSVSGPLNCPSRSEWVSATRYESFSDVGEIRVWFASKILTPCRMH